MNDACSYGVYINQQKAPYDMPEVRWALALSLNLQQVGISAMSGQFKAGVPCRWPIRRSPVRSIYDPLVAWLAGSDAGRRLQAVRPDFQRRSWSTH